MSRQSPEDAIAGVVLDILKGTVLLIGWTGVGVYNLLKVRPAKKLQKLTPNETWGEIIAGNTCSSCGTVNEAGTARCYACGQVLQ